MARPVPLLDMTPITTLDADVTCSGARGITLPTSLTPRSIDGHVRHLRKHSLQRLTT